MTVLFITAERKVFCWIIKCTFSQKKQMSKDVAIKKKKNSNKDDMNSEVSGR